MFGLGGELVKEVDFVFMFCYHFVQAHFVMFSGLLGLPHVPAQKEGPATDAASLDVLAAAAAASHPPPPQQ